MNPQILGPNTLKNKNKSLKELQSQTQDIYQQFDFSQEFKLYSEGFGNMDITNSKSLLDVQGSTPNLPSRNGPLRQYRPTNQDIRIKNISDLSRNNDIKGSKRAHTSHMNKRNRKKDANIQADRPYEQILSWNQNKASSKVL